MPKELSGELVATGKRFAIVVSRFNDFITSRLLNGALDCLLRHGADDDDVTVARVPGAAEIPSLARRLADTGRFDAVICLGAVIRGATPHFEQVCSLLSRGISQLNLTASVPVIFGVITADTLEQAIERAGSKQGNMGFFAAQNAIEMANLYRKLAGAAAPRGRRVPSGKK